jgi:asparagine N-glycosylation enzyme membrane subunit Stt3
MAGSKENGSSGSGTTRPADPTAGSSLVHALVVVGLLNVLYYICREAYNIRLYAINEFGRIIHEFDPYFNYRATEVCVHDCWFLDIDCY